jgi:hypothetical protein
MEKLAPPWPVNNDGQLRQIEQLPYRSLRRWLHANVIPSYPHYIYKYRSVNHDDAESVRRLRQVVTESKLYLSSPKDFNDPFDTTVYVVERVDMRKTIKKYKGVVKERMPGASRDQRRQALKHARSLTSHDLRRLAERGFHEHLASTGVYSFAGDPRSILMWTHYGDNHQGLCLQFEPARDPSVLLHAVGVKYSDDFPIFDVSLPTIRQIAPVLLNKHSGWHYENERRIILPNGAGTVLPFSPCALTGVIFGLRARKNLVELVRQLLMERGRSSEVVRLFQAEKHPMKYKLVLRQLT